MAADETAETTYSDLRSIALSLELSDIGLEEESFPYSVYALIMDTGMPLGSYTLVSVADGSTSLYLSTGGGIIGGGEHESVREAAGHLLTGAQHFAEKAHVVTEFPTPESGHVNFYFVTATGIRRYSALEANLGEGKDEFSPLFYAAHGVISELREIDESAGR